MRVAVLLAGLAASVYATNDAAAIDKVYAPKVDGAWALHVATLALSIVRAGRRGARGWRVRRRRVRLERQIRGHGTRARA